MKNIILFISVLLIVACKKETTSETQVSANISITHPQENDTIFFGDTLRFEGTISGFEALHGYVVTFTNSATNQPILSIVNDEHLSNYTFNYIYKNNFTDTTAVDLKIEVIIDHDGNKEIKQRTVICLPN
jgi:hypothetical protein